MRAGGRVLRLSAVLVLAVFVTGVLVGCGGGASKEPIKIGVIAPLTGTCAKPGTSMKEGVELAVEEINKAGGIDGRTLQPTFEDDASVPAQSVAAAEKLTTKDEVVLVIGAYNSPCVLAHMKVTEREKTPQIDPVAVATAITESGNKWIFRNCATNPMQVNQLADYIFQNMPLKKFAVIHENTDYGRGIAEVFVEATRKYGGTITNVEAYNVGDTDFYAQLTKIKAAAPEALLIGGNLTEGAQITRQAQEVKLNVQLFGLGGVSTPEFDQLAAGSNEGMIVTSYFEAGAANPLARKFIEAYKARYAKDPDMFAAASYEAVYIAKEALTRAGTKHKNLAEWRQAVRDELAKVKDLPGVQGPTTFDEKGQADKKVFIVQWRNHKKVILYPK
ncbi:MAG: ABC transporter substrate-binding protein [Bacillota bacterium]|nr:ABC transporter substrate-binding protein [Bacillota bacterium]